MLVARLSLLLHKLPSEVRQMSAEEADAIVYLLHCEDRQREEETKIAIEKSKMKP